MLNYGPIGFDTAPGIESLPLASRYKQIERLPNPGRELVLQEGIKLFALHGISGLRTRQLAQDAGVNQSAIPYHFGGKLGVYTAVIQYIATELASEIHFDQFDNKLQFLLKEIS